MPGRSNGGGSGGGRSTGGVSGGGWTTGTAATVCNACGNTILRGNTADSSVSETEGSRVCDGIVVTTGNESPVGAERAQTVACRSDGVMAFVGI
jgi:hypothetical protein